MSTGQRGPGKSTAASRSPTPSAAPGERAFIDVWVQPRAARTEVAGRYGQMIKIRLAAPPVDGAANEELVRFLADRVNLARSAVRLVSGRSGRRKRVVFEGLNAGEVAARLGPPNAHRQGG